jgi:hypothetical protein
VTLLLTDPSSKADSSSALETKTNEHEEVVWYLQGALDDIADNTSDDWDDFQDALDMQVINQTRAQIERHYDSDHEDFWPVMPDTTPKRKGYELDELYRFPRVQHKRLTDRGVWSWMRQILDVNTCRTQTERAQGQ